MKIGMLSTIAWRTPPKHYGPREQVVYDLTEGLIKRGIDVTLFATKNSMTSAKLEAVSPKGYEEDKKLEAKVWECLHIANCFEKAGEFDIIHNHFDFLPVSYSPLIDTPMVTTMHGFSSLQNVEVFKKYQNKNYYVSISNSDRNKDLKYIKTVYHGLNPDQFKYQDKPGDYLLFFGRIHHDKGTYEAIQIAKSVKKDLIIAGIIQDEDYFNKLVKPYIDNKHIKYIGVAEPDLRNQLLGNAYALLHPINFREPFGLSIIESMACGTPVVAFRKGSMEEIIKDSITGFLVEDLTEAEEKVKKVKDLKRVDCRNWVLEMFSIDRMVEDYLSVYKEIISGK